ncbi:hypothetical protein ACWEQL_00525 [Kitasatospora sp. NPDC004240]
MSWDLVPGQHLDRSEVHARFGGKPQGRISTAKSSHVLLFITPSDLASRFDGWTGEHVLFGGSGGLDGGDQTLTRYNWSVFRHVEEGRTLRLFLESDDRTVRYIGEYHLDPQRPFVVAEAPADIRRPLEVRRVFVFRLLPLDGPPTGLPHAVRTPAKRQVRETQPGVRTNPFGAKPSPAQFAAAKLLLRYESFIRWKAGAQATGYRITTGTNITELQVELFDLTRNEVVVTLASCARPAVWEALGRLHDQARFFTPRPRRVLLLPNEPDADLAELLRTQHITAVWPSGPSGFARTGPTA